MTNALNSLRDGFRWWMIPALVLLLVALLALVALGGMSLGPAVNYTAL